MGGAEQVVIQNEVFRCGFCPAVFYNSNARNSHMRVHKERMMQKQQPFRMIPGPKQPIQPPKPKVMDENIARLVSNPHITIKPSGGNKRPQPPPPQEININNLLEPVVEMATAAPTLRSYQCIPCGQSYAGQRALYEHKRTCAAAIATSQANANAAKANAANAAHNAYTTYEYPSEGYVELPEDGNQRRFRCITCGKRFYTKANLYFHRKNVCNAAQQPPMQAQPIRIFECPFCRKKFTTESQYTTHILYNHPE